MTDDDHKQPGQSLTTQQRAAVGKSKRNGVSGRLKAALDDMTWNGTPWEEAARKANLTARSMRLALKRPHVLKYLRAERGVMMAQASSATFHRLDTLMRQDENRGAAVAAARTIEQMTNEALGIAPGSGSGIAGGGRAGYLIDLRDEPRAGLVIVVNQPAASAATDKAGLVIDVTPNKSSDDDRH